MKKLLIVIAIICFIFSIIMFYKGYDKMTNYANDDNFNIYENVYVGGDAYNYIINGTYSTAFFVLSAGSFAGGIISLCSLAIIKAIETSMRAVKNIVSGDEYSSYNSDELPPL